MATFWCGQAILNGIISIIFFSVHVFINKCLNSFFIKDLPPQLFVIVFGFKDSVVLIFEVKVISDLDLM